MQHISSPKPLHDSLSSMYTVQMSKTMTTHQLQQRIPKQITLAHLIFSPRSVQLFRYWQKKS